MNLIKVLHDDNDHLFCLNKIPDPELMLSFKRK